MMQRTIGMVEFLSVAKGIEGIDVMLKAADVQLLAAKPLCPGKYMVMVGGDAAEVDSSVQAGIRHGSHFIVGYTCINNVHEMVFPAIWGTSKYDLRALGVVETYNVVTAVRAADIAAKSADIELIELRLSVGLGGKAFITLTGYVDAVQTAVDAGAALANATGELVSSVVIAAPHPDLHRAISTPV